MNFILRLLITAAVAFGLTYVLPGVKFTGGFSAAVVFAVVLAILNLIVKPILSLLGLPLTVITMGLFSFVINAVVFLIADYLIDSMTIDGFWWALVFSIALSIITSLVESIFLKDN